MTITANTGTYLPIQDGRFFGIDISSNQDLTNEAMVDVRANIELELENKLIPNQP